MDKPYVFCEIQNEGRSISWCALCYSCSGSELRVKRSLPEPPGNVFMLDIVSFSLFTKLIIPGVRFIIHTSSALCATYFCFIAPTHNPDTTDIMWGKAHENAIHGFACGSTTLLSLLPEKFLDRMEPESFCCYDRTTKWNTEDWGVEYKQQQW